MWTGRFFSVPPINVGGMGRSTITSSANGEGPAAARVRALADEYVREFFGRHPEWATVEGVTGADHAGLTDRSVSATAAWEAREDAWLEELRSIDPGALQAPGEPIGNGSAAVVHDFLRERLEGSVALRLCREDLWNVSPSFNGWQSMLALVARLQPVATAEERRGAVERFGSIPEYLEVEIDNLREGLRLGYRAYRPNVAGVVEQMDSLLATPVERSPFYEPALRSNDPDFRRAMAEVVEAAAPAIERYRAFLLEEYVQGARDEPGISADPGGVAAYRGAVRYHVSMDPPPEEIHEIGLAELVVIEERMREIAERSFGTSDVREFLDRLRSDPLYTFESREHMIGIARDAVARAAAACPGWFNLLPRAGVEVEPYPSFQEKSAPGGQYNPAPDDGSRPALYLINTYQAERHSRAGLESTAFHETWPGHHLQVALAKESATSHPIARYFGVSGYIEGWALYSERLADEMGLFSSDLDRMGLLSNEALRAVRLVVDSGLHALGWSRDRALDFLTRHTTEPRSAAESEIDRYIAVPGQASSYMLGRIEILRLRDEARERLGDGFDIAEFHDRVLESGGVTLGFLRRKIEAWLEERAGQP